MARIRKRPRVGTLLGTEDRNDDSVIARTPRTNFSIVTPQNPTTTQTTVNPPRGPETPIDPWDRDGGDGSGSNGRSGGSTPGSRGMSLADFTESAISMASNMDPSTAPAGLEKGLGVVADVLGTLSSEAFNEFGEKPGLGIQAKSQAAGTVSQAMGRMGKQDKQDTEKKGAEDYAPPDPAFNPDEPTYNPQDYSDISFNDAVGPDTMNDEGKTPSEAGPGPGGGGNSNGGSPGGDTGGGNSDPGAQGGPGDPAGSPGSGGNFHKGGIVRGKDPKNPREDVRITAQEGEPIVSNAAADLVGRALFDNLNKIARDKKLSRDEKKARARALVRKAMAKR